MQAVLMLVNIEVGRYTERMVKTSDPDVRLLDALADPARLAIVRQLAAEESVCACDFTACGDLAQPTVSHHLRVLREAGVIHGERRGTWIWYRLDPGVGERLAAIAAQLAPGAPRSATALDALAKVARRRLPVIERGVPQAAGTSR
jgi:ArsR family transcriptional regulator